MKSVFLALVLLFSAHVSVADEFNNETELGPAGDSEVASRFNAFESINTGCKAVNSGPRVLLTGFGLFEGVQFNPSGAVLANLADPSFWPATATPQQPPALRPGYVPHDGILNSRESGARVVNRAFRIGGQEVSACLIIADVMWDFAGAVFAREMTRFQPDVVIMSGLGDTQPSVEAGALNIAEEEPGYETDGSVDQTNIPQEDPIIVGGPTVLPMTWNHTQIAASIVNYVRKMGYSLEEPTGARASNEYICNNVSYIMLASARNRSVSLAGGLVRLTPNVQSHPKIGFFHYPTEVQLTAHQMMEWAQVMLTMVQTSL